MNDGQRLLGEDLSAHTALEQYGFPVVVVVVVVVVLLLLANVRTQWRLATGFGGNFGGT